MLSVAARAGPFAPFVSAAAHAVPGPLRPLAPAVAQRDRKVPLEPKRPLLCRESLSGRAARGGLVASVSLNELVQGHLNASFPLMTFRERGGLEGLQWIISAQSTGLSRRFWLSSLREGAQVIFILPLRKCS
ncbi:hypothetical protein Nmel_012350 [Mimus melanotis]